MTLVGTTQIDRFTVLNSEGERITGALFTDDQNIAPGGGTIDYAVSELGDGLYELSYPVDAEGTYYLRLVTETTDPAQIYEFSLRTAPPVVGETVLEYFTVRDDDGDYCSGCAISADATYDPSGLPFTAIVDDLSDGLYRLSWTVAQSGVYTVRLTAPLADVGDEDQLFEFEVRVESGAVAEVSPFLVSYGPSRDDLVRDVALLCRDYYDVVATGDTLDGATWPDELGLAARSPKMFKGASLFVLSAANADNVGKEVRVLDSVSNALSLTPSLPGPVRTGDVAYLTNIESAGFPRQTYVAQINARIGGIFPNALREAVWTFTAEADALFDATHPYLTPPPEFTHITSVSYPSGAWTPTEMEIPMEGNWRAGWYWDGSQGRIVIQGGYAAAVDGREVTIRGFGRWPALLTDTDTTGIDREWLTEMTAGVMIQALRDARRLSEAAMHVNRADALRGKVSTQLPANTYKIR
jgi:hypothetical protein